MRRTWVLGAAGLLLGASIGYFYRPPAFLIGQLPFDVVITRGTNLKGLDQIYLPVAQSSFNYLLMGAAVGAIVGLVVGTALSKRESGRD